MLKIDVVTAPRPFKTIACEIGQCLEWQGL